MSGTSMDAVDSALLRFDGDTAQLAATLEYPVTDSLRDELGALCQPGDDEINRLGRLDLQLGELFAHAALALLEHAAVDPGEVSAIGSHGQTVRHEPPVDGDGKEAILRHRPCALAVQARQSAGQLNHGSGPSTASGSGVRSVS